MIYPLFRKSQIGLFGDSIGSVSIEFYVSAVAQTLELLSDFVLYESIVRMFFFQDFFEPVHLLKREFGFSDFIDALHDIQKPSS